MTYYAQRKSILNGKPQTINNRYGERREMERKVYTKPQQESEEVTANE